MKHSIGKRILAMAVGASILFTAAPVSVVSAANTLDNPGLQLQTILIDITVQTGQRKAGAALP